MTDTASPRVDRRSLLGMGAALLGGALTSRTASAETLDLGPLSNWHYPDARVESLDKRFPKIGNASIERIATGFRWTEGPVYVRDGGYLLFSDIPNARIYRWTEEDGHLSVYRSHSNNANGNTRDREGRLVSCEHATRRMTRTEHDGRITVLCDTYEGKKFSAPNDVVVAADGAVWFTDPGYGLSLYEGDRGDKELKEAVYRLDPRTGKLTVVAGDFDKPNGLAFSPDEKKLYIVDSGSKPNIRVFDVADGKLSNGKLFAEDFAPGNSDGVRTDTDGNVWCSMGWGDPKEDGVRCYTPSGTLIGRIHLPETASNLCFGGIKKNRLFITASTSVYSIFVDAIGAQTP